MNNSMAVSAVAAANMLVALLTGCSGGAVPGGLNAGGDLAVAARGHESEAWQQPIPKAVCDARSRVETGLQGQVPVLDRISGRSQQGYTCNLELVGQYQGEGASWQHDWYEDCAYFGTAGSADQLNPGVVVLDVSNPRHPVATDFLNEPAMLDPWESLKVNQLTGRLAGVENGGPGFSVYDLSRDCTHPELLASVNLAGVAGHEGNWSTDGQTYWGSDIGQTGGTGTYYPIDVADPENPELIMNWPNPSGTHGLSFSPDGNTGYFVMLTLEP